MLISSLEEIKSQSAAQRILDEVKPDWVIWSAGAGGKGDVSRTYAIDRDASVHFTRAIMATPSVTRYLFISAHSVRRHRAGWWHDEEDHELWRRMYHDIIPDYHQAKHVAEDVLAVLGEERRQHDASFQWVSLRPGQLGEEQEVGKVSLGRTRVKGKISRGDVAEVAVAILAQGQVNGWVDLMNGDEDITSAIDRLARTKETSMEGESLDAMKATLAEY